MTKNEKKIRDSFFLEDFQPHAELIVPEHLVPRAKFPAIDAHNHLTYPGFGPKKLDLVQMLRELDLVNVATVINLSGETGEVLKRNIEAFDLAFPGRFVTYCNVDFTGVGSPGWTDKAVAQLRLDIQAGARGLKIYKELGLVYRDTDGKLVMPSDPRLFDIWETAGEAGIPITIHIADPVAFFKPLDRFNERWEELHQFPDWHFYGPNFPTFESLIESLYQLIEAHPKTNFITAHVGCYPENLGFVAQMMERYPNFYTDISARIAELGRAPYTARAWFKRYADRILFGTDFSPNIAMYQTHFRFLETRDENFPYDPTSPVPTQGRWRIHGLYLPDDVLQKVYRDNAVRLLRL